MMVNTKIATRNEKKLDRGLNSGYYRIYQRREKDHNYILIELFEGTSIRLSYYGDNLTEELKKVKKAQIREYLNKICIRFYDQTGFKLTDYEFDTGFDNKRKFKSLIIYYWNSGGQNPSINLWIIDSQMKKEKFLDKQFVNAPVSHLLITDDFEKLYQKKAISLSIVSYPDYTETRIVNLQDSVKFKVLGRTIKNVSKMKITEKRAEEVIEFYDTKEKLVKEIKGSDIIKHKGRLLCLKTEGIFSDIIHLTESDYFQSYPFLDSTKELSKRLLPLE